MIGHSAIADTFTAGEIERFRSDAGKSFEVRDYLESRRAKELTHRVKYERRKY